MAKQDLVGGADAPPPVSDGDYSQVVEVAELGQVRLIGCSFSTQPEVFGPPSDSWKSAYSCEVTEAFLDDEVGLLTGWVSGKASIKSGRRKILEVDATYVVIYEVTGNPKRDAALKFVNTVGSFAVYPYFRAHFASVMSDAGLRVPPLPILKEGRRRIQAFLPDEREG
jgi:hypothetical protein